jgi:hypothetical protein
MEKVVTKKSFIGGRLVYPGEMVDVDEKGDVICAPSTPIGQMSPDQIEAYLRGLDATATMLPIRATPTPARSGSRLRRSGRAMARTRRVSRPAQSRMATSMFVRQPTTLRLRSKS